MSRFFRASADSRPINPAPMTTAFSAPSSHSSMIFSASSALDSVTTPSASIPSIGGLTGLAPVAITR